MNYQAIRAVFEAPLLTAYNDLSPAVPVYFDNVMNDGADSAEEFVHINIQFGLTTELTLSDNPDRVRGVIVIRTYTPKGRGPARNQTLVNVATTALQTINNTAKPATGVYVRTGSIDGPSFSPDFGGTTPDQQSRRAFTPFFISRIEAGFQAQIIS
ncbi:MAG: hypothetical protein ACO3LT_01280 [Ilumatobacteraceae bacterium]|jgi:hypothetical protein